MLISKKPSTLLQSNPTAARCLPKAPRNEMSKRTSRRKKANKTPRSRPFTQISRRTLLKAVTGVGVAAIGIPTLHAYDKKHRTLHDLSVIGQGKPVVVQIHDPSCPTCRRLKSAVTTALKGTDEIHYRLADITTSEGKTLQNKYAVPHVTLLFFDGHGKRLHTSTGLLTSDQIKLRIGKYF